MEEVVGRLLRDESPVVRSRAGYAAWSRRACELLKDQAAAEFLFELLEWETEDTRRSVPSVALKAQGSLK